VHALRGTLLRARVLSLYNQTIVSLDDSFAARISERITIPERQVERGMDESFLDVLVRHRVTADVNSAKRLAQELNALCAQLGASLAALARPVREELLHQVLARVLSTLDRIDAEAGALRTSLKPPDSQQKPLPVELTPDLLEWARRQYSEAEYVAGIRNIREHGGVPFADLIQRLKTGMVRR
jgi:hypothetical protein